uniref:Calcineurin-like phosphoesterase domain-containing protein n=1 Tax=Oncorhynchus kisutch TaxID=8019 RepID=A0A8C7H439_ONCKI
MDDNLSSLETEVPSMVFSPRFATALKVLQSLNPLIVFSGDCLSPSLLSTVTKGKHMVDVLNKLGVHCAVYGNHEFDLGVDLLEEHTKMMPFPWFINNVYDRSVSPSNTRLYMLLRDKGADLGIALTHMRWRNGIRLASKSKGVDLILGGHDHECRVLEVNGIVIVKNGSEFSYISKSDIATMKDLEEDAGIQQSVKGYTDNMLHMFGEVLCHIEVALDGRYAAVRRAECYLVNLVIYAMLEATHAEVAFLNSGYYNFHFLYVSVTGIVLAYMKYYLHILFSSFFFLQSRLVEYRKTGNQIPSTVLINHFESGRIVRCMKRCKSGHMMGLIKVSSSPSSLEEEVGVALVPRVEGRIFHVQPEGLFLV